jgi:hypothetical protein
MTADAAPVFSFTTPIVTRVLQDNHIALRSRVSPPPPCDHVVVTRCGVGQS